MTATQLFPHFDCAKCSVGRMGERGCDNPAPFSYWTDIDGELRDRCPRRPLKDDANWYNELIAAYNFYEKGYLPHAGGVYDQPALFPDLMSHVDHAYHACQRAKAERGDKNGASIT